MKSHNSGKQHTIPLVFLYKRRLCVRLVKVVMVILVKIDSGNAVITHYNINIYIYIIVVNLTMCFLILTILTLTIMTAKCFKFQDAENGIFLAKYS